jgi:hypothetical protein
VYDIFNNPHMLNIKYVTEVASRYNFGSSKTMRLLTAPVLQISGADSPIENSVYRAKPTKNKLIS